MSRAGDPGRVADETVPGSCRAPSGGGRSSGTFGLATGGRHTGDGSGRSVIAGNPKKRDLSRNATVASELPADLRRHRPPPHRPFGHLLPVWGSAGGVGDQGPGSRRNRRLAAPGGRFSPPRPPDFVGRDDCVGPRGGKREEGPSGRVERGVSKKRPPAIPSPPSDSRSPIRCSGTAGRRPGGRRGNSTRRRVRFFVLVVPI